MIRPRILGRPLLTVAVASLVLVTPAAADCQPAGTVAEELPRARVAFVGDVTRVNGSTATFAVTEVWKGDVGKIVEVHGAFDDGSFGEDDRAWEPGVTYLVLPYVDGETLRDTICSATTEWTDELAELRAPDSQPVAETAPAGPSYLLLGIGLVVAIFAAISWIAFRRGR